MIKLKYYSSGNNGIYLFQIMSSTYNFSFLINIDNVTSSFE